ncbi:MAG: ribose 5-phosphate isomerase B [Thermoleophilia bacterium]|nr:ribose 5-phosphate isomerase B [Thermoleophilia bacterium]
MRIAIAADHAGFRLKEKIEERLSKAGHTVLDKGTDSTDSVDYPGYALEVANLVASGEADRGVLVCGTGMGMCIVANKVDGIRAVGPSDAYQAEMSRRHNDANVLCLGERSMDEGMAFEILDIWLEARFEGGRHAERLEQITVMEKKENAAR